MSFPYEFKPKLNIFITSSLLFRRIWINNSVHMDYTFTMSFYTVRRMKIVVAWNELKIQLLCSKCHFLPLHTPDDVFYCYPTIQWTELMQPRCCLYGILFTQRIVFTPRMCCLTCTSKIVNSVCVFMPNLAPLLLENSTLDWVVLTIQWLHS